MANNRWTATIVAFTIPLAGCSLFYDHDTSRPPTDGEVQAGIDLLASSCTAVAALADEALRQAMASPGQGIGFPIDVTVACPAGGNLRTTGTMSARCPAAQTAGRCEIMSFAGIEPIRPSQEPANPCTYANGLVLDAAASLKAVGDESAYRLSLSGVVTVYAVESDGYLDPLNGCVAELAGAVPAKTLTGTYCSRPVNRSF